MLHSEVLRFFGTTRLLCNWSIHASLIHKAWRTTTSHHQHLLIIRLKLVRLFKKSECDRILLRYVLGSNIVTEVVDRYLLLLPGVPSTLIGCLMLITGALISTFLLPLHLFIDWLRILISWCHLSVSVCWVMRTLTTVQELVTLIRNRRLRELNQTLWYLSPRFIRGILTRRPPSPISDLGIRNVVIKFLVMFVHRSRHHLLDPVQLCLLLNHPKPLWVTHILTFHLLLLLLLLLVRAARLLVIIRAKGFATDLLLFSDHLLARHYRVLIFY